MGDVTSIVVWLLNGHHLLFGLSQRYPWPFVGTVVCAGFLAYGVSDILLGLTIKQKIIFMAVAGYIFLLLEWYVATQVYNL